MSKRNIIIMIAVMLGFTCFTDARAGIDPFYKGDWGMSPAEIQKLYGANPVDEFYSKFYRTYEIEYNQELYNQKVTATYLFDTNKKMKAVTIYDYCVKDSSSHVFWEMLDDIKATIESGVAKPLDFANTTVSSDLQHYYEAAWINEDIYINMYVEIKPGETLADYHFYFVFHDNDSPGFQATFDALKAFGENHENQ